MFAAPRRALGVPRATALTGLLKGARLLPGDGRAKGTGVASARGVPLPDASGSGEPKGVDASLCAGIGGHAD